MRQLLTVEIRGEHDVVLTRQRARQIAGLLGADAQSQTRVSTALSEIARNAFAYAGGGLVTFAARNGSPDVLEITVRDQGPGIDDVDAVLDGRRITSAGRGAGIIGAKRLVDEFEIVSAKERGTTVTLRQRLPRTATPLNDKAVAAIVEVLAQRGPQNPLEEMRQQNQELMRTLEVLQQRQTEVERLNRELEETNRGVLALYSELDEKAQALKRASELKSQFLSNMTHELRTPLNSVVMVSRLLIDGTQGPMPADQLKPVQLINRSAISLLELVNDLLDLAKIEAGKIDVNPTRFTVADLFGGLRGVIRPLVTQRPLELIFDEGPAEIPIFSDEGKVAQILRNLLSNAIKFTERGHVRVSAELRADGVVAFVVTDTGVGIAPADQALLFTEFTQVGSGESRAKGTGLGLSLSLRLAELLGGTISVRSELGKGSSFTVTIPDDYSRVAAARTADGESRAMDAPASVLSREVQNV